MLDIRFHENKDRYHQNLSLQNTMVQLIELALDLGLKGHCVVSFSETLFLLHCTGSTYEDL